MKTSQLMIVAGMAAVALGLGEDLQVRAAPGTAIAAPGLWWALQGSTVGLALGL